MLNRITYLTREPGEEGYGDFWVVSSPFGSFAVAAETALALAEQLQRECPPQWLSFADRAGSRVCVRTPDVRAIYESTAAQRAYDRRMARAREREERADQAYGED